MRIDEIVFAMPQGEALDVDAALGKLGPRVVDITVGFDLPALRGSGGGPLILVPVWRRPLAGLPTVVKRAMDVCASSILLAFLLPLMVVIAALVKLDSPRSRAVPTAAHRDEQETLQALQVSLDALRRGRRPHGPASPPP